MPDDRQSIDLESRLAADEQRLLQDEQRLLQDERRLLEDEARLEVEDEQVKRNRAVAYLTAAMAVVLAVAVTALVLAVLAIQDDVDALGRRSAPSDSVSTGALQDASVTAEKLASGAVGPSALQGGAVGTNALAADSVFSEQVAPNALTGADIRESSLRAVPAAETAERLGERPASSYLASPVAVSETGVTNREATKGPLTVRCPAGTRVLSGGAAIEGAAAGASLVRSLPDGTTGWTATAHVARTPEPSWRLVVTAICAATGG
jgi:hypothetical protein